MGRRTGPRLSPALIGGLVGAVALALAPIARADWMLFGGAEKVFDGEYAAMTALLPFSEQLGRGFVHRYGASYIRYEYPEGDDTVQGETRAIAASLGYQVPVTDGWFGIYTGAAYRDTTFDPRQPDNRQEGRRVVPTVDIDGGLLAANRWLFAGVASYTPGDRAYWTRARALRRVSARIFVGPEIVAHGDRDYDARQTGLAAQFNRVIGPFDIVLKAGGKRIRNGDSGAYGGIEVLRHFQ